MGPPDEMDAQVRLERLERRVARERAARNAAEELLEQKSREIYELNRHLEKLVQERTRALALTLDNMAQGIVMLDGAGSVAVSNARAAQLLEVDGAELGAVVGVLVAELDVSAGEASSQSVRPSGRIVETRCCALPGGGAVATFTDISSLKAREAELKKATAAAEAANETKSRFLSTMSHEMRTPLNGIIGSFELLNKAQLDSAQRMYVDTALEASEALLSLINDVLDFAKLEAGKRASREEPFELADRAKRVLSIMSPQAVKQGSALTLSLAPDLPQNLQGDVGALRQILLNLVGNAVKFTQNGGVEVKITRVGGSDDAPLIEFAVTDTGPGIPAEQLDQLFREFSMLDASYARKAGGTGLGLAITKRLVEALGGTIGVTSEVGVGSCFFTRIPFKAAHGVLDAGSLATSGAAGAGGAGMRVLLVDDNATNRLVGSRLLEAGGHQVVTANGGRDAMAVLRTQTFDCVLMDISMPEMDGIEATRHIREAQLVSADVPIVALTANVISGDRERFLAAGLDDYLTKPLRRAALEELLLNLRRARLETAAA